MARMPRKARKERLGQRERDGEEIICYMLGKKRKADEARKERIARKGKREKDGR